MPIEKIKNLHLEHPRGGPAELVRRAELDLWDELELGVDAALGRRDQDVSGLLF